MAEDGDKNNDEQKSGDSKRMTKAEYDRLVKGVDDIYFGGKDEPEVVKPPPSKKSDGDRPKDADDHK